MSTEPILHVDMTPDAGLPVRILRVYRANCDVPFTAAGAGKLGELMATHQRQRAVVLDKAITTLERGAKVGEGMSAARAKGRLLGRPVKLAKYLPVVKRLHKKMTAEAIHRHLRGRVSLAWIYLQLRKLKGAK